ncbi:transketolase [bacterium]|nr:transketolase [bacterium]
MACDLDRLAVNTIRLLSADGVQKAKSGHPGMPMGMADVAYVLWTRYLKYNPTDPEWPNRDRFVLSAGHGSMLLYSMLHLSGYDLSMEDLQQFRQLGSRTPGHPEFGRTPGVEATTGPLGQGISNGVGMALASKILAAKFNATQAGLVDHYVYGICSDGDLMEGVASEAASLAGHWGLGNLIFFYDDNAITIEGSTELAFTEDVAKRFEAYGWQTLRADGHDHAQIAAALEAAQADKARPTLILTKTHIGMGSPNKQDTSGVHGEPLGDDELAATKANLGWPADARFLVPDEVRAIFTARAAALKPAYDEWQKLFAGFKASAPELAAEWKALWSKEVPADLFEKMLEAVGDSTDATRNHGGKVMQIASAQVPALYGGSADLAPSNKTLIKGAGDICRTDFSGRNLHFGIREHAMGAICNGMAYYGAFIPYGSTFLVFSDYMRPSIRVGALSHLQTVWVFTHDSIFVGEDGPTHEPVEHVAALRAIPNLTVLRPGDGAETAAAWSIALSRKTGPSALCLTRQSLQNLPRPADMKDLLRGCYVTVDCEGEPELIILGSGSEAALAVEAAQALQADGIKARAISLMSWEVFEEQEAAYRESVLPSACRRRVAIEAGIAQGWERYIGLDGLMIGMTGYGESAPYKVLADHFGFTPEKVLAAIREWW